MQKKRIFITGIAGFIGFHLANRLIEEGHTVFGIDSFNDYYSPQLKRRRAHLLESKGAVIHEGLIQDKEALEKALAIEPTHIVHLAAQAGVRYSYTHPDAYIESNILGFYTLLSWNKERKIPFLFASSSSVYGNSNATPFTESALTDSPSSLYAATKKCNELLAYSFHHQFGSPCLGLRFFTVYGPWGRPDMAYFSFTESLLQEKPIVLYDEGRLLRDFTYIDDIIEGVCQALSYPFTCDIINLGNHLPCSVLDLVKILESLTGKKALIEYRPRPLTDVVATFADIEKARLLLGFSPKTPLEKGLAKFYDWYEKEYLMAEI